MAFRQLDVDLMIKGVVLAMVEKIFPEGTPTLGEFSRESSIDRSTFRRTAQWLLGLLPGLLAERRPGPRSEAAGASRERERKQALMELQDLWAWSQKNRKDTEKNTCFLPEAKLRIATVSERIQATGVMTFEEIAAELKIEPRQLGRIRAEVAGAGGKAPPELSRRPDTTADLAPQIQKLIGEIENSASSRNPYGPTDVKRILEKNYPDELREHHGHATIALSTVAKYMGKKPRSEEKREHPRGSYRYPEPFQQVAIDTSYFKIFGITFYLITVFEMAGRLNLLTRVFLRKSSLEVVEVLEEYLEKYPGVEAAVIDRGTPYLNEEVRELLESRGRVRLVSPPETPTAKAAIERHFRTLKVVIRKAATEVFKRRPRLSRREVATALEFGTAVFQQLYHQIPQEGIDGKAPAERIESFDPVRAARLLGELFERSLAWEPSPEYARTIHARFQLANPEEETVRRLGRFETAVLRRVLEEVTPYMGPPFPGWMYDPLGYLEAKARKIQEEKRRASLARKYDAEKAKKDRADRQQREQALEDDAAAWREQPERYVDQFLKTLVCCAGSGFQAGLKLVSRKLRELLESFSERLGSAFRHELDRLRERIRVLSKNMETCRRALDVFDELVKEIEPGGG